MHIFFMITLFLFAFTMNGCSPYWYREHHNVHVADSKFNRLQITLQLAEDKPRINCEINGEYLGWYSENLHLIKNLK